MNRDLVRAITQEEIETFREDGVVCLRGMFDPEWCDRLRDAADTIPGNYSGRAFLWPFYEPFRELVFDSPAGEIAATLMGSETLGIMIDICFIKDPHSTSLTPWHHDQPYYQMQGKQVCGMWIGLDKCDASNGAVEWIKGSHKWDRMFEPDPFDGTGHFESVHDGRERILDIDADRDNYDIVMFETEPGDCIVDYATILHAAGDNTTDTPRRAITYALFGDDARFLEIPPSRGVEDTRELGLKTGDRFPPDHELAPRIWPKRPRETWPSPKEWAYTEGAEGDFVAVQPDAVDRLGSS
ncbi:MAG: phytanoyl-CoA dioxygenase family protein [Alphaproteobacteria bacterium]|nr:hypothetical protein [Rhodospirillaceae bacterium]MDG2479295.1 phytanoyl-CoA dioxygenase family protein [Alphaproteobacteria bacterium]MBT6202373.1 hypothetical protein [Rhodospirillaceae bacterium]MBT6512749.1 hypothetical protein [Rhodospirillaceae bacterium]MBT7614600.1 hypothetical protein [Rhodospirillaceae bacterium]